MPRKGVKALYISSALHARLKRASENGGYGMKGMSKLLNVLLDVYESLPILFKKR